jgi:hypothetical protein
MAWLDQHEARGMSLWGQSNDLPENIMTISRYSAAIAFCASIALAGSASAAGMGGGHMGGGMGGGHMGGGMGGGHMGGGHMGGGMGGGRGGHMAGMGGHGGGAGMRGGNRMAANGNYNRGGGGRYGRGGYGVGLGLAGFGLGYSLGGYDDYDNYGYGYGPDYATGVQYGYGDEPVQTGRSVAVDGGVCLTPVRSCQLSEPVAVGTPCSCVSRAGTAHGSVTP